MANDWYLDIGYKRLAELRAGRAQALADLEYAKSNADSDGASTALQNIADIDAAEANLGRLYDQYVRSQQPPPEPSPEERAARPVSHMDWQDVVNLARQSKYARNIRADDPALLEGWREAQRRRSRGE
jgi:hypothetical protein